MDAKTLNREQAPPPCEDCHGTGMVPSIGPEAGEVDGYVPCQSCKREGGREVTRTYTYRGPVEVPRGGRYVWREGYSATTDDGHVLYPRMTRSECHKDARKDGLRARFAEKAPEGGASC